MSRADRQTPWLDRQSPVNNQTTLQMGALLGGYNSFLPFPIRALCWLVALPLTIRMVWGWVKHEPR